MQAHKKPSIPLGVIEGFFGREWSWTDRNTYANFLAQHDYQFYIYAPKSDKNLRTQWQQDWPLQTKKKLEFLRNSYREAGVQFGLGLSPHEIYIDNSHHQRHELKQRIKQLNDLEPDILCILFDDMRGDILNLADIQIDIAHEVADLSNARQIIFCPTYYSFDPVLEKVFGAMPVNYWRTFAQKLDKKIDMFWTGEKVCSPSYSGEHLLEVEALIGRKPFLWDNYPVNDGAIKSNFLQLRPFHQSHNQLDGKLSGHAVNPMNQAWLSQIPLASLPLAYHQAANYSPQESWLVLVEQLGGTLLAQHLAEDLPALQDRGLKNLTSHEQTLLKQRYLQFPQNPFATEIIDWLDGGYTFDPNCLTE